MTYTTVQLRENATIYYVKLQKNKIYFSHMKVILSLSLKNFHSKLCKTYIKKINEILTCIVEEQCFTFKMEKVTIFFMDFRVNVSMMLLIFMNLTQFYSFLNLKVKQPSVYIPKRSCDIRSFPKTSISTSHYTHYTHFL